MAKYLEQVEDVLTMTEHLLERLNEMEEILAGVSRLAPILDPDELEAHDGSWALAWLASPPVAYTDAARYLELDAGGALRFGFGWAYIEGVADAYDLTISELLDACGIAALPTGKLVRSRT